MARAGHTRRKLPFGHRTREGERLNLTDEKARTRRLEHGRGKGKGSRRRKRGKRRHSYS